MQVTDTLRGQEAYRQSGFSDEQARALARQQEVTAQELVEHIRQAFAVDFSRLETKIESVARDQLFKIIAVVLSSAALTIASVSLLLALNR
jgi:hypothetical protein